MTHLTEKINSLEFQVNFLRTTLNQVIGPKFNLVTNRDPDEFKNEMNSILCSFKHPDLPSDWFKSYRKKVLSQVLESAYSYFKDSHLISDDKKLGIIITFMELFENTSTDQLELVEFLLNFKSLSTYDNRFLSKFVNFVDEKVDKLLSESEQLLIEILKKYPENTKWHHFDGTNLSISCYLMTLYFELSKNGYEDENLEFVFLKFVFNHTFGLIPILPKSDHEKEIDKKYKRNEYELVYEKYWICISHFLLKASNQNMEKLIDEYFKFTDDYRTSFDVMLDFGILLIEHYKIENKTNEDGFARKIYDRIFAKEHHKIDDGLNRSQVLHRCQTIKRELSKKHADVVLRDCWFLRMKTGYSVVHVNYNLLTTVTNENERKDFYFEVNVIYLPTTNHYHKFGIGCASEPLKSNLNQFVGMRCTHAQICGIESYGYHSDGSFFYNPVSDNETNQSSQRSADRQKDDFKFKAGDIVGCGFSSDKNCVYFTKNGKLIGLSENPEYQTRPVMSCKGCDTEGVVLKIHSQKEFLFKGFEVDDEDIIVEEVCCICMTNQPNILFYPCKHKILCTECSKENSSAVETCPICREDVLLQTICK